MKIRTICLLAASGYLAIAQTPPTTPGHLIPGEAGMQEMDHAHMGDAPIMQADPASSVATGPDLLREAAGRKPMGLDDFQQLAVAGNPTLKQAAAIVAQSSALARQAGLYPNPSVGYQGEQIRGGSYRGGEEGAYVQQSFILGGKLGLRRAVYEQQRRTDEFGASEQHFRVLSDVGQSFYSALAAQQTVLVRKQLLSLALDAVTTAHQLGNVGQADAPDILQAEVEGEQAKLDYTTAQRQYLQSFRALASLVGSPGIGLSPLTGELEHPPQLDENQIIDEIGRDSPSIKRAQQDVQRSRAELKDAKREAVPDVQIRAGLQQNSEPLNEIAKPVGLQGFASAGIALPIFNRNQGNVAAAKADLERTEAEVRRVQLHLRQDAQPVLQSYLFNQAQAERYKTAMIPRAARAYQLYLAKYRNMAAAYPQVLVSQRTYFQLQVAYIATLQSLWTDAITLQNFLLTSGLTAPMSSGPQSATVNLPSSGVGVQ